GTGAGFEELPEIGGVMLKRLTESVGLHGIYCKIFNRSPYQSASPPAPLKGSQECAAGRAIPQLLPPF
ncbi:hypothetical protein, partial [Deinococcus marmoris]|uniref:hypothetical protein n=1 Tax=Deinococcus marmoris TaxID=249408 RepID=UPI0039F12799